MTSATEASTPYDEGFYTQHTVRSLASARVALAELWRAYQPVTVVDVGCGAGAWLAAALELGAADAIGLDGDYVPVESRLIAAQAFRPTDLSTPVTLDRRFDLAISVEVAEHLSEGRAQSFVADLARLAPVVLFSAAVPGQGGTNHVNERWPEYWRDHFANAGLIAYDPFRLQLWADDRIDWWYRQNLLLFASPDIELPFAPANNLNALVHPGSLQTESRVADHPDVPEAARILIGAVSRSLAWRLDRMRKRSSRGR